MKKVYEVLIEIKEAVDSGTPPSCGLCECVYNLSGNNDIINSRWDRYSILCFKDWKHFNGSTTYPVPDPNNLEPDNAYGTNFSIFNDTHQNDRAFWVGEYGELRKDLLNHCIEWFMERDL